MHGTWEIFSLHYKTKLVSVHTNFQLPVGTLKIDNHMHMPNEYEREVHP